MSLLLLVYLTTLCKHRTMLLHISHRSLIIASRFDPWPDRDKVPLGQTGTYFSDTFGFPISIIPPTFHTHAIHSSPTAHNLSN